jgi:hypothetical protein
MHAAALHLEYKHLAARNVADVEKVFQYYNLWIGERESKMKSIKPFQYEANSANPNGT